MKRALQIVSLLTLVTVIAAIVAQAFTITQGVYYTPNGQLINPSALTQVVTVLSMVGILAMSLTTVNFALGSVVTGLERRYAWLVAVIVAGGLAFAGLIGMAWILLSERSPVALQAPLAVISLVTLAYTLLPALSSTVASPAV
jgi:hypothetical protein